MVMDQKKGVYTYGWVQVLLNVSEGHEPKPPQTGLPGEWSQVVSYNPPFAGYVWTASPPPAKPEEEKKFRDK